MSERPTPRTAPLMHAAANESIEAMFKRGCDLERQLADRDAQLEEAKADNAAAMDWRIDIVDRLFHARKALQPFAAILEGQLDQIGGGTLIRPEITVQMVKDAQEALARIDGNDELRRHGAPMNPENAELHEEES